MVSKEGGASEEGNAGTREGHGSKKRRSQSWSEDWLSDLDQREESYCRGFFKDTMSEGRQVCAHREMTDSQAATKTQEGDLSCEKTGALAAEQPLSMGPALGKKGNDPNLPLHMNLMLLFGHGVIQHSTTQKATGFGVLFTGRERDWQGERSWQNEF